MATFRNASFGNMVEGTLKKTASALRDADIPFCLVGSLSAWVRGGPESSHDLDFGIREQDVMRACEVLEKLGYNIEIPPEDWLVKAWDGPIGEGTLVDLIHHPVGIPITDEELEKADLMDVLALKMRVLNPTSLIIMKALSLREQNLNLTSTIATIRALREVIDWKELREKTAHSPYACGLILMCEQLGLCPLAGEETPPVNVLNDMQQDKFARAHVDGTQRKMLIEHLKPKD